MSSGNGGWKRLAVIAITACLSVTASYGMTLVALNKRPTAAEVAEAIERQAPYVKDREFVVQSLATLTRHLEDLDKKHDATLKQLAELVGELRAQREGR